MPAWLAPAAISAGASLFGGLFGGKQQKAGYEMSPEEKKLLAELWGQYGGAVPGHVTAPFVGLGKDIKQRFSRRAGSSAKEHSIFQREVSTPMAEAGSQYKKNLLSVIMALTKGTGTRTAKSGAPWGDIMGGIGQDVGSLWGLEKMLKMLENK